MSQAFPQWFRPESFALKDLAKAIINGSKSFSRHREITLCPKSFGFFRLA
jgi:hypothetical protein